MLRKLLELGRYLLVIPVIGSLLLTAGVVLMAAGLIVERSWHLIQNGEVSVKAAKIMSFTVIQTIDFFLVGALGYITAVGIYNLFIASKEDQIQRIRITKLKDLEDKIIGVVVAALAVAFLGSVTEASDARDTLFSGAAVALVISSLCLFIYFSSKSEP